MRTTHSYLILRIAITSLFILVIIGCGSDTVQFTEPATSKYRIITDAGLNFQVEIPNDWRFDNLPEPQVLGINARLRRGSNYPSTMTLSIDPSSGSLKACAERVLDTIRTQMSGRNSVIVEKIFTKIGDKECFKAIFDLDGMDKRRMRTALYLFVSGDRLFRMNAGGGTDDFIADAGEYEHVAASLKFIEVEHKTIANAQQEFQMTFPGDWAVRENLPNFISMMGDSKRAVDAKERAYVSVMTSPLEPGSDLKREGGQVLDKLKQRAAAAYFEILEQSADKLNNAEAYKIVFLSKVPGKPQVFRNTSFVLISKDRRYVVTMWTLKEETDKYEKLLCNVVASFKVIQRKYGPEKQ